MKKKLISKRAAAHAKMKTMIALAKKEERELTEDELAEYNTLDQEYIDTDEEIRVLDTRDTETKTRVANLEARERTLDAIPKPKTQVDNPDIGMDKKELKRYSIMKAIRAAATGKWDGAELEREASEEVEKRTGEAPRSFYIPPDVLGEKRDLDTTTGAGAIGTELLPGSFIDMLYNKMVVKALGATTLSNLTGVIEIPKKTGMGTGAWVAEGGATTKSNATLGQVILSPKTVTSFTELTRKFMKQTSIEAENFVRNDLAIDLALAIDFAAMFGTGAGNQPKGIANQTGVGLVAIATDGGPITWSKIVDLETAIGAANADIGALAYATNSKVRGACKKIEKASGTARFLMEDGKINDYMASISNQIPSDLTKGTSNVCSAMLFGNWNDLLIGLWGGLDILVNPFALDTSGGYRVSAFQDIDIQVRHPESFAKCVDITTA